MIGYILGINTKGNRKFTGESLIVKKSHLDTIIMLKKIESKGWIRTIK